MENKIKLWIARDEDGELYLYFSRPLKGKSMWRYSEEDGWRIELGLESDLFPSVKWKDVEPTEAYITLAEPQSEKEQSQSKQEQKIDWEQRRYEIAKEMLPVLYQQSAEILKCGQSITWEETAVCTLVLADTLIAKLKEQSE